MVRRESLLVLLAVAAVAHPDDVVSLVQQSLAPEFQYLQEVVNEAYADSEEELGAEQDRDEHDDEKPQGKFQVGDHVLMEMIEGEEMGSWVKGSITGMSAEEDSYNVHLWVGGAKHRTRANVPVELLRNATVSEIKEALRLKAEDDELARRELEQRLEEARRAAEEAALQARREAEEARRQAEEARQRAEGEKQAAARQALKEAARKKAEEEAAKRKAWQEAEAKRKAQEEARKKLEQEVLRREALKARWETVKASKLKEHQAELAALKLGTKEAQEAWLKYKNHARLKAMSPATKAANEKARVTIKVVQTGGDEFELSVRRRMPLKVALSAACEHFGLQKDRAALTYQKKPVDVDVATAGNMRLKKGAVFELRGPRAAPAEQEAAEQM